MKYRRLHGEGEGDVIRGAEAGVVSHCGIEGRESLDPGENPSLAEFERYGFGSNDQGNDWSVYGGGSKWSRGKWILSHHDSGVSVAVAAGDGRVIECRKLAVGACIGWAKLVAIRIAGWANDCERFKFGFLRNRYFLGQS